jgi:hypothetical protein
MRPHAQLVSCSWPGDVVKVRICTRCSNDVADGARLCETCDETERLQSDAARLRATVGAEFDDPDDVED